jgi:hypothetical protein
MDKLIINKTMQFFKTSAYYLTYFINALKLKKKIHVQKFNCFHIKDQGAESLTQSLQNEDRIVVFLLLWIFKHIS